MLRLGDRVTVLAPAEHRGRTGLVEVPVWTPAEGQRAIGVRLDAGGRLVWVTAVERVRVEREQVD